MFMAPIDYTVVAPLTSAVVFVCATLLSNVVADYKESEKMPAEISAFFQSLLAAAVMQEAHHERRAAEHGGDAGGAAEAEKGAALRHVEALLLCVLGFLDGRFHYNVALSCFLESEMALCEQLERWGRTDMDHVEHVLTETRKKMCRMVSVTTTSPEPSP